MRISSAARFRKKVRNLPRRKQRPDLRAGENGTDLVTPKNRDKGHALPRLRPGEDLGGIGMRAAVKTPAHGDRVIEDEGAQARPYVIRSRMLTPGGNSLAGRAARMRAAACCGERSDTMPSIAGCSRALSSAARRTASSAARSRRCGSALLARAACSSGIRTIRFMVYFARAAAREQYIGSTVGLVNGHGDRAV